MNIVAVIPARMESTRFPGKPMEKILGKPMIGHVYERVAQSQLLDLVVVATCNREIFDYIESIGGVAVMTGSHHERASDRCAEALPLLEAQYKTRYDVIVMVQGDEPMTHPQMIEEALQPMFDEPEVQIVNLMGCVSDVHEFENKNCVKVVCDLKSNALYFSREPIPTRFKTADIPMAKQVAVMPFRRDFLLTYTDMQPTPLEIIESVDMMRVLEHGMKVRMAITRHHTCAVDVPSDIKLVEDAMRNLKSI
jgi:3-deoxy-manno-octulosonate cytidylyltransferase (CMP-KDO synthetase)